MLFLQAAAEVRDRLVFHVRVEDGQVEGGVVGAGHRLRAGCRRLDLILAGFLQTRTQQLAERRLRAGDEDMLGHVKSLSRRRP